MKTEYSLSKRSKLQIAPLGDLHYGSPQYNEPFFEKWKNTFKGLKGEKGIILMGDLGDIARKGLSDSAYQQEISADEQITYVIKQLKPFRKYIYGLVDSNHHARLKELDFDINVIIADQLGIKYTPNVYLNFKINDEPFKIFATHGSKVSSKHHLMLGTAQRSTAHIDANLICYAHCHQCGSIKDYTLTNNEFKERTTVLTGSFLKYGQSYAEKKLLKPYPCAFPLINIGYDSSVNVNVYTDLKGSV